MKKICMLLVVAALVSLGSLALSQEAKTPGTAPSLPTEINQYFSENWARGDTLSGIEYVDSYCFVLIRTHIGSNRLFGFQQVDGTWKYRLNTATAVPQGDKLVTLLTNPQYREMDGDTVQPYPALYLFQWDVTGEYQETTLAFLLQNDRWNLYRYYSRLGSVSIKAEDDKLTYYKDYESDEKKGSAYGVLERDLRHFSLSALPKTLAEARDKLSTPPAIPAGGLQAQRVRFTSGQKFPVYTGPGTNYYRSGNGKAAVSTNDWIQVFGVEYGWAMIQYDLSSTQMRIGYIEASALPKNAQVPGLNLVYHPRVTSMAVSLTDDPLFSKQSLVYIPAGSDVIHLNNLGTEWAYVEYANMGIRLRGFVPQRAVTDRVSLSLAPDGVYNLTKAFSRYQAKGVVMANRDGSYTLKVYALLPAQWKTNPGQGDVLVGYRFYDGNRPGDWLQREADYQGLTVYSLANQIKPQSGIVGLIPVYSLSGEVAAESLILGLLDLNQATPAPLVPQYFTPLVPIATAPPAATAAPLRFTGPVGYHETAPWTIPLDAYTGAVYNPNPADRLHLRAQPRGDAASLGKYYNGVQVVIDGPVDGEWTKVIIGNLTGYMKTEYLVISGEGKQYPASAMPVMFVSNPNPARNLHLRAGQSTYSTSLGLYSNGTKVTLMGFTDEWAHVILDGNMGFMLAKFLK